MNQTNTQSSNTQRVAFVQSCWHRDIVDEARKAFLSEIEKHGLDAAGIELFEVPGAFEIPLLAKRLAPSYDAVICLGAVIRGDTPHFDYVAGECAAGIQRVALDTDTPVIFGVLTTDNLEQAMARAGGEHGHKGSEAARTAVEMVSLLRQLPAKDS